MEAFSLLKYWKAGGASGVLGGGTGSAVNSRATTTTTILTAVATKPPVETDDEDDDEDDDGPFFDLEFSVPDEEEGEGEEDVVEKKEEEEENNGGGFEEENGEDAEDEDEDEVEVEGEGTDGENESEFKFTLSSGSSNDRVDQNLALSPSDDLFFKGRLVPIEPSSHVLNGSESESESESESNLKPQFPVSFMKSATKFRVLMLKFKKSRLNAAEKPAGEKAAADQVNVNEHAAAEAKQEERGDETSSSKQSKFFTVKFKVEEIAKVSLFTRENRKSAHKSQPQSPKPSNAEESAAISDEKRFSKDVMQKYLKKVKPLYVRISKRYGEKLKFSGQLSFAPGLKPAVPPVAQKSPPATAEKSQTDSEKIADAPVVISNVRSLKQGNLPAGLRDVCKHLGKSRSASSAVAAAPPAPATSKRRDDSLLQQQDGIQSAILHCKRSFNAHETDSDSSVLYRSVSDPSHEKKP